LKVNVLGISIDSLTVKQAVARIEGFVGQGAPHRVITANPELIYCSRTKEELRDLINSADLVTADGEGIVWAAKHLGNPVPERVTGIDLAQALFPAASRQGWKIFLLGAAPGVAEDAACRIREQYPQLELAGSHGYFQPGTEERAVIQRIRAYAPQVLLVGMGAPRQEEWIYSHFRELAVPVCMGVGGSFDVISGRVKRAPLWVQRLKLEWLARLMREPSRFKRQLALPKFAFSVLKAKFADNPQKK